MNEEICLLSNDLVYGGALKCGNESVRDQKVDLSGYPENIEQGWLRDLLDPDKPVVFLNTDGKNVAEFQPLERKQAGKIVNDAEVKVVQDIVNGLMTCGIGADSVGVICPFRAQVSHWCCLY